MYLQKQLQINGMSNVEAIQIGLGSSKGSAFLYYEDAVAGEGTASIKYSNGKSGGETVQIDSLDNMLANRIDRADFIKIDVEGFQKEVFKGGWAYFQRESPVIMVELKEKDREDMADVEDIIRKMGYSVYEIHKNGLAPCSNTVDSKKRNFILAKQNSESYGRIKNLVFRE